MLGAAIIVIVLVVLLPVAYLMTGGVVSAIIGWAAKRNAEETHEGSELIDLYY